MKYGSLYLKGILHMRKSSNPASPHLRRNMRALQTHLREDGDIEAELAVRPTPVPAHLNDVRKLSARILHSKPMYVTCAKLLAACCKPYGSCPCGLSSHLLVFGWTTGLHISL